MLTTVLAFHLVTMAVAHQLPDGVSKDGMMVVDNENGVAMRKPTQTVKSQDRDKWKCYSAGAEPRHWFRDSRCLVTHVIDALSVDVAVQWPKEGESGGFDISAAGKQILESYDDNTKPKDGKDAAWKEVKYAKKEKAKQPPIKWGECFEIEAVVTEATDAKVELHEWIFKEKDALVRVVCFGGSGEYKKKLREVLEVLGNIKVTKPPKKK